MLSLVDESLPRQLAKALGGHDARTVAQMGWTGTSNGELLSLAEAAGFEALITADRNLEFQQNVARFQLGVIVIMVPSTNRKAVLALVEDIADALGRIEPGRVLHVGTDPRRIRSRKS